MRAIILAAGLSSRLRPLTDNRPKCLLPVAGLPIIRHQLTALRNMGIGDVTVVTGYCSESIQEELRDEVAFRHWPAFASTGNLHTLHHCRDLLCERTLILFSDVLIDEQSLRRCVAANADAALLADLTICLPGTMRIRCINNRITDLGHHIDVAKGDGTFVGVSSFSAAGALAVRSELERFVSRACDENANYTAVLPHLASIGLCLEAIPTNGAPWIEIDTVDDYHRAQLWSTHRLHHT